MDFKSNIANQNLKNLVLIQNLILNRMRLFSASESQYNRSKRKIIVYNISKNTYFGVGNSNIANQKLKKQVLTQNFIRSRMPLFSASESQYNISKWPILQFCSKMTIRVFENQNLSFLNVFHFAAQLFVGN